MIEIFFLAFVTVFLAEIGDKTQLVSVLMSARYPAGRVYLGAVAAVTATSALAVTAGSFLAAFLPEGLVATLGGLVFIATGLATLLRRGNAGETARDDGGKSVSWRVFGLVFLAEMGDKTLLVTMSLAALSGRPALVFAGAASGHALNHALGVFLGSRFLGRLSNRTLRLSTGILFIVSGGIFFFAA